MLTASQLMNAARNGNASLLAQHFNDGKIRLKLVGDCNSSRYMHAIVTAIQGEQVA